LGVNSAPIPRIRLREARVLADGKCPFCVLALELRDDEARCPNGHVFDAEGLSLATNMAAARALWLAVSAMQDDAAGLAWRAQRSGAGETADALLVEAQAARDAATTLRRLAAAAQRRLDTLVYPTVVVRLEQPASEEPH
jgi:hypothetical protein